MNSPLGAFAALGSAYQPYDVVSPLCAYWAPHTGRRDSRRGKTPSAGVRESTYLLSDVEHADG